MDRCGNAAESARGGHQRHRELQSVPGLHRRPLRKRGLHLADGHAKLARCTLQRAQERVQLTVGHVDWRQDARLTCSRQQSRQVLHEPPQVTPRQRFASIARSGNRRASLAPCLGSASGRTVAPAAAAAVTYSACRRCSSFPTCGGPGTRRHARCGLLSNHLQVVEHGREDVREIPEALLEDYLQRLKGQRRIDTRRCEPGRCHIASGGGTEVTNRYRSTAGHHAPVHGPDWGKRLGVAPRRPGLAGRSLSSQQRRGWGGSIPAGRLRLQGRCPRPGTNWRGGRHNAMNSLLLRLLEDTTAGATSTPAGWTAARHVGGGWKIQSPEARCQESAKAGAPTHGADDRAKVLPCIKGRNMSTVRRGELEMHLGPATLEPASTCRSGKCASVFSRLWALHHMECLPALCDVLSDGVGVFHDSSPADQSLPVDRHLHLREQRLFHIASTPSAPHLQLRRRSIYGLDVYVEILYCSGVCCR